MATPEGLEVTNGSHENGDMVDGRVSAGHDSK